MDDFWIKDFEDEKNCVWVSVWSGAVSWAAGGYWDESPFGWSEIFVCETSDKLVWRDPGAFQQSVASWRSEMWGFMTKLGQGSLKLKVSERDVAESLKAVFEQTTEISCMISKQFQTEVARGLKRIFQRFKYKASKYPGVWKLLL